MEPLIIAQVKERLAQNDLDGAVNLLNTYAESNLDGAELNRLRNEIIHIQGQISEVKNAERKGLIAFEQAERNRNQIRLSMLSITDTLSGFGETAIHTTRSASPKTTGGSGRSGSLKYIAIGAGSILLLLLLYNIFSGSNNAAGDAMADSGHDGICHLITHQEVNVLESASPDAAIIGTLYADTEFEVVDTYLWEDDTETIQYFAVTLDDGTGWIACCDGIELDQDCQD